MGDPCREGGERELCRPIDGQGEAGGAREERPARKAGPRREGHPGIALAVIAEISAIVNGRGGGHLRNKKGPLHSVAE